MVRLYYNVQDENVDSRSERLPNALDVRRLFDPDKIAQIDAMLDHVSLLDGLIQNDRSRGAIGTRTFIPHRCHKTIGVLGAVSVATACSYNFV